MINLVLADDHFIVRSGLRKLVEQLTNVKVLKECANGVEVMDFVRANKHVDMVIADLNMPLMGGMELTYALKSFNPDIKVLILSMYDDLHTVAKIFEAGASVYLLKSTDMDELAFAIQMAGKNRKYIGVELMDQLITLQIKDVSVGQPQTDLSQYSERELEVLQLIAAGLTNMEISHKLFLSKRTIEGHRQSLLQKTGSNNTASLIRHAIKHGMVD